MKKLTLAIFLAVAACVAVAQGPGGPGRPGGPAGMRGGGQRMSPEQRMAKMKKDYNLSDAQVKKIEAYNKSQQPEMEKIRKAPGDFKAKMPMFKKMMDERNAKMKTILTKEQYAKFEKDMKARMGRMGGGRPGGRPGGPGGPAKGGA